MVQWQVKRASGVALTIKLDSPQEQAQFCIDSKVDILLFELTFDEFKI